MKRAAVFALALVCIATANAQSKEVQLKAKDGVTVYAYLTHAKTAGKAIVLMFHQAGSSHAEYTPIIPSITKLGFDCLALDQRLGDGLYGENKTAKNFKGNQEDYAAAYPDLVAALDWAKAHNYKKIVAWGSSYSAALTLRLNAEHGKDLAAALAFSPGEYIGKKGTVRRWASRAKVPMFLTGLPSEVKESILKFYDALPKTLQTKSLLFTNANSVHGSSTLRQDKNPKGYKLFMTTMTDWLKKTVPVK